MGDPDVLARAEALIQSFRELARSYSRFDSHRLQPTTPSYTNHFHSSMTNTSVSPFQSDCVDLQCLPCGRLLCGWVSSPIRTRGCEWPVAIAWPWLR
jgi:hypothetical protein